MRSPRHPQQAGFTLVEVLIALLVFAMLTTAGAAVLSTTITNRLAVKQASDRVADLQRLRALLKADLGQTTTRRIRDLSGRLASQPFATGVEAVIAPALAEGETSGRIDLAERGWSWTRRVAGTDDPEIQRIDIAVLIDDPRPVHAADRILFRLRTS